MNLHTNGSSVKAIKNCYKDPARRLDPELFEYLKHLDKPEPSIFEKVIKMDQSVYKRSDLFERFERICARMNIRKKSMISFWFSQLLDNKTFGEAPFSELRTIIAALYYIDNIALFPFKYNIDKYIKRVARVKLNRSAFYRIVYRIRDSLGIKMIQEAHHPDIFRNILRIFCKNMGTKTKIDHSAILDSSVFCLDNLTPEEKEHYTTSVLENSAINPRNIKSSKKDTPDPIPFLTGLYKLLILRFDDVVDLSTRVMRYAIAIGVYNQLMTIGQTIGVQKLIICSILALSAQSLHIPMNHTLFYNYMGVGVSIFSTYKALSTKLLHSLVQRGYVIRSANDLYKGLRKVTADRGRREIKPIQFKKLEKMVKERK